MPDPKVRHAAGELLAGAVLSDDRRYLAGILGLVEDLDLTATQTIAVSDRLQAVVTLARILIRGLSPPEVQDVLGKIIQRAADNVAAWDVLREVTDGATDGP